MHGTWSCKLPLFNITFPFQIVLTERASQERDL
jgi:hypothetical protein